MSGPIDPEDVPAPVDAPSPVTPEPPGPVPAARPPMPKARALVSAGLDLCLRANATLRAVSVTIGTILVAVAGPFVVLLVLVGGGSLGILEGAPVDLDDAAAGSLALALLVSGTIAILALAAIVIECRIVAIAILGGHAVGRPVAPHEALRRSRQVYWRVVGASIIVGLPVNAASGIVSQLLDAVVGPTEATLVLSTIVATVVAAPFAYTVSGLVLGGVGAFEAIRRSWEMARYRWSTALVVAVAETLAQTLLVFAVFAGLDILVRVGGAVGLGLEGDTATTIVTLTIALAATAAVGSLLFTVAAIATAPQVVAFVGLTGYGAGLDPARDGAPGARPVRWLSVPMAVGTGSAVVTSILGVAAAARGG